MFDRHNLCLIFDCGDISHAVCFGARCTPHQRVDLFWIDYLKDSKWERQHMNVRVRVAPATGYKSIFKLRIVPVDGIKAANSTSKYFRSRHHQQLSDKSPTHLYFFMWGLKRKAQ
jgi:hypothetical protein